MPQPISGQFAGVSGGALVVAGGSSFPVPLFEGGRKIWAGTVFVLEPGAREWRTLELGRPLAYGGSVSVPDGMIILGGGDAGRNYDSVLRLRWRDGALEQSSLPKLPGVMANGAAALLGSVVYCTGGQASPDSTSGLRQLWALDLGADAPAWRVLEPVPGPGRILPVFVAQGGALYLFSGAELYPGADGKAARRYLKDGWSYRPGKGWRRVSDAPHPVVAAPALPSGESGILVFGGDDGENAARVWELKDKHPGFRKEVRHYDVTSDAWSRVGTLPVGLVTTTPVLWQGRMVIPGGEDRPGHRSATVLAATNGVVR